jgi:uncharacterized protein (DUF885 family)
MVYPIRGGGDPKMKFGIKFGLRLCLLDILVMLVWVLGACTPSTPPMDTPKPPQKTTSPTVEITAEPTTEPTKSPLPATTPDPRSAEEIAAELERLPINEFFDESYRQLILRSPEMVTTLGLADGFGMRNDRLDDLSTAYILETQALERAILDLLRSYDRDSLSQNDQVSYDVYEWYLDDRVQGHKFMYHNYPFHHFYASYHERLGLLFNGLHPLNTRQDVEDYITRLTLVDAQVDQLLEEIQLRTDMGVVLPKFIVGRTKVVLFQYLGTFKLDPAEVDILNLDVYTTLSGALRKIDSLSDEDQKTFRDAAIDAIETSYLPAYFKLSVYLNETASIATDDAGVWKHPEGEAYYEYMLRKHTSTDLTPDEVHTIGLAEVDRILEEIRVALIELGYDESEGLHAMWAAAEEDAGYVRGAAMITEIEALLEEAALKMDEVFSLRPKMELVIVNAPNPPASYEPGSLDGSRPGAFMLPAEYGLPRSDLATISYHEAIPGHYFQVEVAREMGLPLFRTEILFNAYLEGWALYAERLAWEVGLYEDNPYGNLGRLRFELMRAIRLVVDTGIHAFGWTRDDALAYTTEVMGSPSTYEIDRFVVSPGQSTGYSIGMLKILELRQRAMDQLGDQFDFGEFHQVVIGNGAMPLEVLVRLVDDYIDREMNGE